jgi:spectinomycin phosphotransferase
MKFEPVVDRAALIQTLRQAFGLPVTALTFFPEGTVGCHYIADCENGQQYFVTLLTEGALANIQRERLDFILALRSELYARGLFTAQPAVHCTLDGKLKADFEGQPLTVSEYVTGANLWDHWPPDPAFGAELGRLTARLHNATPGIKMQIPYVEKFTIPFESILQKSLADIAAGTNINRPGQQTLRNLVLPRCETIRNMLAHLHELGTASGQLNAPQVLVHTDMHGGNLIRTPSGELVVVDWEGLMLAPAEFDLFMFMSDGFDAMLEEYLSLAQSPRLFPEIFAFKFYHRNLEDIAYFLVSILYENTMDEQDQVDLGYLQHDCLDGWASIEASIQRVRDRLCTAFG